MNNNTESTQSASFDIREHTDKLESSGKNKTKFICPVCNGRDLSISFKTGAYQCFDGCKPEDIREAIAPWQGSNVQEQRRKEKQRPKSKAEIIKQKEDAVGMRRIQLDVKASDLFWQVECGGLTRGEAIAEIAEWAKEFGYDQFAAKLLLQDKLKFLPASDTSVTGQKTAQTQTGKGLEPQKPCVTADSDDSDFLKDLLEFGRQSLNLFEIYPKKLAEALTAKAKSLPVAPEAIHQPFMATAASVVGTRAKVYVSEGWKEPLVIFSGFVADPGSRKSAAMSVSRVPLVRLQESAEMEYAYRKEEYDREKRRYDALGKKAAADHEPPVEPDKRHYYLEDSTLEAAMAIHAQEPSKNGFVMIYDELAELIDGFDQYKSKGGSDRKKVLRFFNGSDIKTDRKTQKSSCFIPESAISITGAIQEGTLKRLISTSKDVDGMWDRFLWCFPRFVSVRQRGNPVDITEYLKWIYQELDSIPEQSYYLSDTARRILTEFEFWIEDQRHEVSQPVFLAYSKLPGLSARLALFLHLIDAVVEHRPIVPTISAATMQRAIKLMNYYISQIHLLHGRASEHNLDSKLVGIIELSKDKGAVSTRDIQRKRIAKNTEEASNLLSVLIERGLGNTSQGARGQTLWTYDPNALTTDRETFRIPSELVTEAKNESIPCREPVSADFSPVTLETVEVRNEPRFDASNLPMQSREREAMPVTSPAGIPAQRAAMESESSRCGSTTDGEVLAGQSSTVGAGSEYPFSEGDRVIDSVTGLESTVAEVMDDGDGTVVYFLNGSVNDYRAAEQLSKPLDVASTLDWRGFQVGDFVECVFPEWMDERSRKESAKMKEAPYGARGTVKELVVWDLKFGGKVVPAAVVEFEFGTKRLALDQLMRLI